MAEGSRRWVLLVAAALLAGCDRVEVGPAPYGFELQPEQHFRLQAQGSTDVDGTPVTIQRMADVRLVAEPASQGHEIALYLVRYYLLVKGAPGGTTELLISQDGGFSTIGTPEGNVHVGPDELGPGGASPRKLLSEPVAGFIVDTRGGVVGRPWSSLDPLLAGVHVLDWVLLSLPVLDAAGVAAWDSERPLPAIGRYQFGIDLPVRYERKSAGPAGDEQRILATGVARRSDLEITPGFSGDVSFDYQGESDLDAEDRVIESRIELQLEFVDSSDGGPIHSRHRVKLNCTNCPGARDPAINPASPPPDNPTG